MNQIKMKIGLALILSVFMMAACNRTSVVSDQETIVKVPVTATGIRKITLTDYLELNATSTFLNKSVIKVPVTGYIEEVFHLPGDYVERETELFTMKTKEAAALKHDSLNPLYFQGLVHVKASINGMILSVEHPKGDFVEEGDIWGVISVPSSLVFVLEAPFEASPYVTLNSSCDVVLPGGETVPVKIKSKLASMAEGSQTRQFILQPVTPGDIPENLIAKVRLARKVIQDAIVLPKACILTDEVMKNFWVMKLVNDTLAVKVPVIPGLTEGNNVQITEPVFSDSDLFLSSGNYGLGDSVRVVVIKK